VADSIIFSDAEPTPAVVESSAAEAEDTEAPKKKRGRPPKLDKPSKPALAEGEAPRKRGRPRKNPEDKVKKPAVPKATNRCVKISMNALRFIHPLSFLRYLVGKMERNQSVEDPQRSLQGKCRHNKNETLVLIIIYMLFSESGEKRRGRPKKSDR
jgi:hypothetical protein